ncbi:MAG TPA: cupin domain-containing protein [Puia sp.]|nr:cupin domain-containing protein [Puia sp.]
MKKGNEPKEPIISQSINAVGNSLVIHEWKGSGPPYMHVHYEDDEAWYVMEGILTFKFIDRTVDIAKGTTVFVPAGIAHTYSANDSARYLMILTPRLNDLIAELQISPIAQHASIMKKYKSEIID